MDSFQRFAPQARFQPRAVADVASALEAETQRRISDLQRQQGQEEQRAQNRIVDSQVPNRTMEALSQFSATASKFVEDYAKRTAKDIEVGAQFDSIYNPTLSPAEQQILDGATVQQATAGQAANQLEAEGDVIGAENLRQDLNRVGQGVADERAKLIEARSAYPSEIQQIINSNQKLAELYNQNPMSALEIATKMFIENRGLQYTTKRNFVDVLGQTIRQTNSYMAQGQVSARIKEEKDVRKAELLNNVSYAGTIATTDTANIDFQMLTRQVLDDNNGILTQGGANRAVAKALLQGASTVSEDQINIIAGINVNPNQPNTTIGSTYSQDVQQARLDYQALKTKKDRARRDQVINDTLKAIQDPNMDPATRVQMVYDAAEVLEAAGDREGAFDLKQKAGLYAADPEATANFVTLQQRVAEGSFTPTNDYLNQQVASGQLTQTAANSIRVQRDKRFETITDESKVTQQVTNAFVNSQLKTVIGAQFDPTTGEFNLLSGYQPLDKGTVKALSQDYKGQLKAHMERFVLTLNPDMEPDAYRRALSEEANRFYEEQTQKPSGEFWMGGLFTQQERVKEGTPEAEAIRQAGRKYGSRGAAPQTVSGKDLSLDFDPSVGVTPQFKAKFSRGDAIYTQGEVEQINGAVGAGLGFPSDFVTTARRLDMTPLELLNSHMVRYGYPTQSSIPEDKFEIPDLTGSRPGTSSYRTTAIVGMNALMGQGFSPQAAAVMAAYLYVRSGEGRNHTLNLGNGTHTFDTGFTEGFDDKELEVFKNPTATFRQILKLIPKDKYNKNLINYANDLLKQAGIY